MQGGAIRTDFHTQGNGILPTIEVGDNVLLAVPSFDRNPANLVAVVMDEREEILCCNKM